jgi:hypothetical protein
MCAFFGASRRFMRTIKSVMVALFSANAAFMLVPVAAISANAAFCATSSLLPPPSLDPLPRLESVAQVVDESLYFPMGHLVQMTSSPLKMVEVAAVHVRVADPADMW